MFIQNFVLRICNIFEPIQFGSLRFMWGGHVTHRVSTSIKVPNGWLLEVAENWKL